VQPTCRPSPLRDAAEDSIQFHLVLEPVPAHQRHPHGPETPAEERHHAKLDLGEPPTPVEHTGAEGERLYHVKVAPADVVGDYHSALALG